MALSDLTGTSWKLKSGTASISNIYPYYSSPGTRNLNLVTNLGSTLTLVTETSHDLFGYSASTTLKAGTTTLGSASTSNTYVAVNPPSYVTVSYTTQKITITGGSDATNATLISWFETYADFVPEPLFLATETELTSVADAIRTKTGGSSDLAFPFDFVSAIGTMVVPSGNQDIENLSEYDVSAKATARVSSAERDKIIASNIKSGVSILGVSGNLPVPTGNINITSTASVDVTNYATAQVVDANLLAENIKNGITILGITGTASGGTLPTMYAPGLWFNSSTGWQLQPNGNGSFVSYYDIYKQSDNSLITSIPGNGNYDRTLTNDYSSQFPLGNYSIYAKARGTNFNDSQASESESFYCCSITKVLTNMSESSGMTKFINGNFVLNLVPTSGYYLPSSIEILFLDSYGQTITRTATSGTEVYLTTSQSANDFSAVYSQINGTITFSNGNGLKDITVTASGDAPSGYTGTVSNTGYGDLTIVSIDGVEIGENISPGDSSSVVVSSEIVVAPYWGSGDVESYSGCTYSGPGGYDGWTVVPTANNWTFAVHAED